MAHHSEWGPSGLIVEQVVRRAATLTDDERARLYEAWQAGADPVYDEAWGRVGYAASKGRRDPLRASADARAASGHISVGTVRGDGAVRDAAVAASVVDLVGQYGLTAEHVDALMGPWLDVVGDPRVDPTCRCDGAPVTVDLGSLVMEVDSPKPRMVGYALGALAPQPGDQYPWLVMEADSPEPLIVGYAATGEDALALAEQVDGPAILWRAGKETS